MTETEDKSMMQQFLDSRDICFQTATSLLNSNFIDELTNKFLYETKYEIKCKTESSKELSKACWPEYLSTDLEFATSLTNIDGIESEVGFNKSGETRKSAHYKMKSAKDFGHFQLGKEAVNEGQIPLDFHD